MFWKSLQESNANSNQVDYFEDRFDKNDGQSNKEFEFWDQYNKIFRPTRYNSTPWKQSNKIPRQREEEFWDQSHKITREEEEEFEFVEPMVFDLVRGLGAKPGESEVNYLMIIPLNGDPATFSPGTHSIKLFYKSVELCYDQIKLCQT
jgi:hypothetical protein